ncbi:unnamed protein product [Mytilus edulis]|uniref:Uncharacterized protein n=1 Tax=Mytilus edulis TaxID=6550 RepID=A0A8S3R7M2_MYTED|nr:unnamed protein product [Mytilus edulis]
MATPTPSPASEECPSLNLMEDSGVAEPSTTGATEGTPSSTVEGPSGSECTGAPVQRQHHQQVQQKDQQFQWRHRHHHLHLRNVHLFNLMEDSGVGLSITYDDEILSADTLIGLQSSDDNRKLTVKPSSTVTISLTKVSTLVSINGNGDNIEEIT